jgi:hypothetical protein
MIENRLTKELFATEADCLRSLFTNNQTLLESLYPALGHRDANRGVNPILRSADVGVVRLPLKEVSNLCQIGSDLSVENPLSLLVQGQKVDAACATYLITVSLSAQEAEQGAVQLDVKELSEELFEGVSNLDIKEVLYCDKTKQLVVNSAKEVSVYSTQVADAAIVVKYKGKLTASSTDTKVLKVEQGHAFVQEKDAVMVLSLEKAAEEVNQGSSSKGEQAGAQTDK